MDSMILHKCFHENHMVLNPGKYHYIVIGDTDRLYQIILNNNEFARSSKENKSPKSQHPCQNKSLPHTRSETLAIKFSNETRIQLLLTDLEAYLSIFKYCIKQHLRTSLVFGLQAPILLCLVYKLLFDGKLEDNKQKSIHEKIQIEELLKSISSELV